MTRIARIFRDHPQIAQIHTDFLTWGLLLHRSLITSACAIRVIRDIRGPVLPQISVHSCRFVVSHLLNV